MESKFKGTPGPWYTQKYKYKGGYEELMVNAIIDPIHGHSAPVCMMCDYEKDQMDDNARLIAAAPELLDALQELMKGVAGLPPLAAIAGALNQQYQKAEAAINKVFRGDPESEEY